jgi:serine/threonine protein kinase
VTDDTNRVEAVFWAALSRPVADRPAFLDQACAGDEELRRQVDELLRGHEAGGFLEVPALAWLVGDSRHGPPGQTPSGPPSHGVRPGERTTPGSASAPDLAEALGRDGVEVVRRALDRKTQPAVPGYEILGELGRGGMGVVYQARHLALKRTVALKMILAGGHAGADQMARFRIEAEAVARLQHPNIVQIHEVGEADGHPYCALEFVEGGSLAQKLHRQPLPVAAAARLVETLARAVQLAHSRNVVHRDLKPANVLLTADGTPKVTDFGLARQLDSDHGHTQSGAILGTPSYMAPEQAEGRTHDTGPAADVYALGAILYECLAGRPPFVGQTLLQTLEQVRTQEPPPPSRVARPGDRATTTVPLDLSLEGHTGMVHGVCFSTDGRRLASAGQDQTVKVWDVERGTETLSLKGHAGAIHAVCFSPDGRRLASGSQDQTVKVWDAGRGVELLALKGHAGAVNAVCFSPDGRRLASAGWDRAVKLWDTERGTELLTFKGHTDAVFAVAFSPDGKRIASSSARTVKVWDAGTGVEILSLKGHKILVASVCFSADGRRMASGSYDTTVRVWDAERGTELVSLKGHRGPVTSVCFRPGGDGPRAPGLRVASAGQDQTVNVWDVPDR